jgi:hypothetical protein
MNMVLNGQESKYLMKGIIDMQSKIIALSLCIASAGCALDRDVDHNSKQAWKAEMDFEFPLGGNSIGLGGSFFGDQAKGTSGVVEQVSMTCVMPSEVLVQNLILQVVEDETPYRYELNFNERAAAPNGMKTVVVSRSVKIRVRFGFGGFGIGLNVWNGTTSMRCTALVSGYMTSERRSDKNTSDTRIIPPAEAVGAE